MSSDDGENRIIRVTSAPLRLKEKIVIGALLVGPAALLAIALHRVELADEGVIPSTGSTSAPATYLLLAVVCVLVIVLDIAYISVLSYGKHQLRRANRGHPTQPRTHWPWK